MASVFTAICLSEGVSVQVAKSRRGSSSLQYGLCINSEGDLMILPSNPPVVPEWIGSKRHDALAEGHATDIHLVS